MGKGTTGTRSRAPAVFQSSLAVLLTWLVFACSSARPPEASAPQTEEAQSRAEYDLGVDFLVKRGQPRAALSHALKALELDDQNAAAAHLIALIYLDFCQRDAHDCRLEDARRHAQLAIEVQPEFREARNTLGVILIHQKRYQEAIAALRPLTQDILYNTPENAWGNLGWAYLESGQLRPAIAALRRSVAIQPAFCVGHYRLALAYEGGGQTEEAYEQFTKALSADARCIGLQGAYAGRSRVGLVLGRQDSVRNDLESCVRLAPATAAGRECKARLATLAPPKATE